MSSWVRNSEREPVELKGVIILPWGRPIRVTVLDISPGSCRVACGETLPTETTVRLEIGAAVADAEILWSAEGEAGLRLFKGSA